MRSDSLSVTFAALADPTRRAILTRLAQGEATVTELAAPHAMSASTERGSRTTPPCTTCVKSRGRPASDPVSTTVGAEGIETRGLEAIDVTDEPMQFAERIATLMTDERAWEQRREVIAELVRPWLVPQRGETWTGALEKALSRRRHAEHSILVQH